MGLVVVVVVGVVVVVVVVVGVVEVVEKTVLHSKEIKEYKKKRRVHFQGIITSQQSQPHIGPNNGIFPGRFFTSRLLCKTNQVIMVINTYKRTNMRNVCGFKVSL